MAKKTKARRAPAAAAAGGDLAPVKRDADALAAAPAGEGGSEWRKELRQCWPPSGR